MDNGRKVPSISELSLISNTIAKEFLPLLPPYYRELFNTYIKNERTQLSKDLPDANLIPKEKLYKSNLNIFKTVLKSLSEKAEEENDIFISQS